MTEPVKLMTPGPVDCEEEVLAALAQPSLPHYGRDWLQIYNEVIERLKELFGTRNDLILMPGPGTAGLDAALGSLARTGEKVLVASNGFFGDRFATIAAGYGLDVCMVRAPLEQPLDPDAIRRCLATEAGIQAIALVHLETSTGVLNPLQPIAAIGREFEVPVIVDAVSSLGGVPLPVDNWGIDICVAVINKCLGCPPGVAPISISPRAWEQIDGKSGRAHGWYLNLQVWKDYSIHWASWHPYPTTLPTHNIVALLVSLRRILDGGLDAHYQRHVQAAALVRAGLKRLGFELFAGAYASPLLTAVRGLPGMEIADFRHYLMEEWRVMVSGGLEELKDTIFRVGHIGRAADPDYGLEFLRGAEAYLQLKGYPLLSGAQD